VAFVSRWFSRHGLSVVCGGLAVTPHTRIRNFFLKAGWNRAPEFNHLVDLRVVFLIIHAPVCSTLPSAIVACEYLLLQRSKRSTL
jgi:hypothetical protein